MDAIACVSRCISLVVCYRGIHTVCGIHVIRPSQSAVVFFPTNCMVIAVNVAFVARSMCLLDRTFVMRLV